MTASTCTASSSHADRLGFSTKAIHVGSEPEHSASNGVSPAIDLSTTYSQGTIGATKFEYSRSSNPTRLALERQLAALEGADVLLRRNLANEGLGEDDSTPAALALSSGSTATATVVQSLAGNGGHIVSVGDVYGGTSRFMTKVAANLSNVTTSFVDMSYSKATDDDVDGESEDAKRAREDQDIVDRVEAAITADTKVSEPLSFVQPSFCLFARADLVVCDSSCGLKLRRTRCCRSSRSDSSPLSPSVTRSRS